MGWPLPKRAFTQSGLSVKANIIAAFRTPRQRQSSASTFSLPAGPRDRGKALSLHSGPPRQRQGSASTFSLPDTLATGILFQSDYSIRDKARTRSFIGPRPRRAEVEAGSIKL